MYLLFRGNDNDLYFFDKPQNPDGHQCVEKNVSAALNEHNYSPSHGQKRSM
jgi:hypothetical protein